MSKQEDRFHCTMGLAKAHPNYSKIFYSSIHSVEGIQKGRHKINSLCIVIMVTVETCIQCIGTYVHEMQWDLRTD